MNAHEILDRFLSRSPRSKVLTALAILIIVGAVIAGVFYLGVRSGDGWASSRYVKERDQLQDTIRRHEDNERQLAGENALLKKQNEAAAEMLKANDAKLAGDATKFADILIERNRRYEDIDADRDFDTELCMLCREGRSAGFAPFSFCGRCKADPKDHR